MNIQGLNPLSSLFASDGATASTAGLLGEGGSAGLFSATLLDQLAQLQHNLLTKGAAGNAGLADLQQQFGGLGADALNSQNMQDFAALFGKSLPTASKLEQDINLDDTLHTLADVLQYLQSLEAAPVAQQAPVLPVASANQPRFADIEVENAERVDQQAATVVAMLAGIQTQSAVDTGNKVDEVLNNAVATGQAMSAIKKSPELPGMDAKQEVLAAPKGEGDGQSGVAPDGRFAKVLPAEDGASRQFTEDTAGNAFQGEQAALPKNRTGSGEADGGLGRMTADITLLNKAVNSTAPATVPAMAKHLTHPEWNTELGEKLLWMHKQAVPSAEIRLNPEHLGPISIKIDVNQDQASVAFTAQHAAVREAIEAAIPRLREMLGGQSLNLADVNVSQQQSEQKQGREFFQMAGEQNRGGNGQPSNQSDSAANESNTTILDEIEAGRAIASNGLLSLFA